MPKKGIELNNNKLKDNENSYFINNPFSSGGNFNYNNSNNNGLGLNPVYNAGGI